MQSLTVNEATLKLFELIEQLAGTQKTIFITGKRNNAVLISEKYRNSISETLDLLSVSGMRESIIDGLNQDLSECTSELDF